MRLYLVDGTFELFRAYYADRRNHGADGASASPTGAVRGLVASLLALLRREPVDLIAVAFDHVIESFRNDLFPGYKSSAGVPTDLLEQFGEAEEAVRSLGIVAWPMIEFEADDALATAAVQWRDHPDLEQIIICSPDKDLAQVVHGNRVVTRNRMRDSTLDEAGVYAKFGVPPASIPDYLALVGDSADGIPGVPSWGSKSAAAALSFYGTVDEIPRQAARWGSGGARQAAAGRQPARRRPGCAPVLHAHHLAPGRAAGRGAGGSRLARRGAQRLSGSVHPSRVS